MNSTLRTRRIFLSITLPAILCAGASTQTPSKSSPRGSASPAIPLQESSRKSIASEIGGAFMSQSRCDAEGNLYIRKYAMDRPMLGPVVKIGGDGQRAALFDPAAFTQPRLDRADAFVPAPDGGLYQIASTGGLKPELYVLHFSLDGSPGSAIRLEAGMEPYTFAAFPDGNLLVSGMERDPLVKPDHAKAVTAVFAPDGSMLSKVSFAEPNTKASQPKGKSSTSEKGEAPRVDLSDAEPGQDGNIYALRRSSPAMVYVISPAGKIVRTMTIHTPGLEAAPNSLHVSGNQIAVSFWDDQTHRQTLVVADGQTGQTVATYVDPGTLGTAFACYSADDGAFTFLHLGEANALEVVRAEAR